MVPSASTPAVPHFAIRFKIIGNSFAETGAPPQPAARPQSFTFSARRRTACNEYRTMPGFEFKSNWKMAGAQFEGSSTVGVNFEIKPLEADILMATMIMIPVAVFYLLNTSRR
jgi:hypothetical protein